MLKLYFFYTQFIITTCLINLDHLQGGAELRYSLYRIMGGLLNTLK